MSMIRPSVGELQGILTATPVEEAIGILDRKCSAYLKSGDAWPVRHAQLAQITERCGNDDYPRI